MVFTVAVRDGWSRRAVLGAAGSAGVAAALSGCTWLDPDPPPPPPPDPLEPLLAATRALADRYQRVLTAHPPLADRLRPLYEAHRAHAEALLAVIGRPELASPSPEPGARTPPGDDPGEGASPDPGADPGGAPGDPAEAVAELREAERAGQEEAAEACLSAPPERAALLGSITAARASHVAVLS